MTENTQPSVTPPPNVRFEALQNPEQHAQFPDPDIGVPEPAESFPPRNAPQRHRPKTHARILPPTDAPPTLSPQERHSRKCQICNHPEREAIEEEFVNWHYPWNISAAYKVRGRSLYRHAHAMGLFAQRERHLRSALERILERSEEANVTGETVIRAVRAYTCLTDDNKWVEPASHVIYSARPLPDNVAVPMLTAADQAPVIETSGTLIDTAAIRK